MKGRREAEKTRKLEPNVGFLAHRRKKRLENKSNEENINVQKTEDTSCKREQLDKVNLKGREREFDGEIFWKNFESKYGKET